MVIADTESLQGHGTDGLCSAMATLPILPLQEETHMWQLAASEQTGGKSQTEGLSKAEGMLFYNPIMKVVCYHFCYILFLAIN